MDSFSGYCAVGNQAGGTTTMAQSEPTNLWDTLFGSIGQAIGDVREKLVEEAWFGRAVTHSPSASERADTQSVAQELGWVKPDEATPQPGPDHDLGHAIER